MYLSQYQDQVLELDVYLKIKKESIHSHLYLKVKSETVKMYISCGYIIKDLHTIK